ncbi:MAG: hypothetical protein K6T35_10065, partial [Meiothermus silvanus]|nr:hypothetical protein [Allomeiothermus silvanus]
MELHPEDPVQWASLHFAEAELGDARRVKRAEGMAVAMLRAPGESLPRLFMHPREVKAAYRFLDNPHVDPEGLHAGHRQRVRGAMQAPGTYLRIEDSSEFSYSGRQPVGGLGFIGNAREGLQGFVPHSVLAVRWCQGQRYRAKRTSNKSSRTWIASSPCPSGHPLKSAISRGRWPVTCSRRMPSANSRGST